MFSLTYKDLPETTKIIEGICKCVDIQVSILHFNTEITKIVLPHARDLDYISEVFELSQCGYTLDSLIELYYTEHLDRFYS